MTNDLIIRYYFITLLLSVLCTALYIWRWNRHFNTTATMIYVLVPLVNMGYLFAALSVNLEEALLANKICYLGGCFLQLFYTLSLFSLCNIPVRKSVKLLLFAFAFFLYANVAGVGYGGQYYKEVHFAIQDGRPTLFKVYGPVHALFYLSMLLYTVVSIGVLLYAYRKKREVSRVMLALLVLTEAVDVGTFFLNRVFLKEIEWVAATYVFTQLMYLIIVDRICLYDVTGTVAESMVQNGGTGLFSLDFKRRYLGSNETARVFFPEFAALRADKEIPAEGEPFARFAAELSHFDREGTEREFLYERGERSYKCSVGYLWDGKRKRGYRLTITDDTESRKYIRLLNNYNVDLIKEVEEKTAHIRKIQNKLVLGMAMMVEGRDNSTGGHINRTSEVVEILIDELRKDNALGLTEEFCDNVIKAAPMHDLGKIAVDDAVLRKPSKFTPEEFEKMKVHAEKGAEIVHKVLDGVDDSAFRTIAENIAQCHHERWDGSGYPDGKKGEEIPIEARIMAVDDVYDALVSKRCYKDKFSFEEAYTIIDEGMGTQFDPALRPYFAAARKRLEEYYAARDEE